MVNIECGFQQTPQPNIYGVEAKFPTPEQMTANHERLLVMLSGQRNKDGSAANTPEFLAGFFGYSVDHVNSLIAEAVNPTLREVPILTPTISSTAELQSVGRSLSTVEVSLSELPAQVVVAGGATEKAKKEKELVPGERAYFMGMAKGKYLGKRGSRYGVENITVRSDTENEEVRNFLEQTYGIHGETTSTSHRVEFFLPSPQFDFLLDPNPSISMLENAWRFAPFLLGVMHSKGVDKDGRLVHPDEDLLRTIETFYSLHFDKPIGEVQQNKRTQKRSPFLKIKDIEGVYSTLYGVPSVQQIPFVEKLPGYPQEANQK